MSFFPNYEVTLFSMKPLECVSVIRVFAPTMLVLPEKLFTNIYDYYLCLYLLPQNLSLFDEFIHPISNLNSFELEFNIDSYEPDFIEQLSMTFKNRI